MWQSMLPYGVPWVPKRQPKQKQKNPLSEADKNEFKLSRVPEVRGGLSGEELAQLKLEAIRSVTVATRYLR